MPARPVASKRLRPPRDASREPAPDAGRIDLPVARLRLTGLLAAAVAFIAGTAFALVSGTGPVGAAVLVFGGASLRLADTATAVLAGVVAAVAAIVPRVLSGPAERPVSPPVGGPLEPLSYSQRSRELRMGLQAALAASVIVLLSDAFHLEESAWAITACTYVIGASTADTLDRVRRRVLGTLVGVPLGLMLLPVAAHAPVVLWLAAALAMVVYAMALPERYEVACGAYAFTLMVTLAAAGERSTLLLAARAWETLIGGAIGLTAAVLVLPLRPQRKTST